MYAPVEIECLDCGARQTFDLRLAACARCGSEWGAARYDLEALKDDFPARVASRPFDFWRYLELLPVASGRPAQTLGEGGTPLFPAPNLGMMIGLPHVFVKDERQGPTASFKDRQAALTVAALKDADITEAVVASTGNVAISFSAYCARAGIKLWAFLTSLVPAAKMHEVALYGTQVVKITSTYDQAKALAAEFAGQRGLYLDRGGRSIPSIESMKTLAFEMAEQLAALEDPPAPGGVPWRAPDWYIQPVSGGLGPAGVLKGFEELKAMGLVDRVPAVACIQAEGCAPMVQAWRAGKDRAEPVTSPNTHIATLSTGDPGRLYTLLRQAMLNGGGGTMESVSDEEAIQAMHAAAKLEGLSVEPATAVAFAGLFKLAHLGVIRPDDVVVVNCTGHTLPIEKEFLGEGWHRDIILAEAALPESPQEGLLAALRLEGSSVRSVLVADDHADARRLIRRILQAQGDFDVREVASGAEALAEAERLRPDLVILDLMMPEMDGFSVIDHLKAAPETAEIPVIVVTAKELTNREKARLRGQIARLMLKGEFFNDDLLQEINQVLQ